MPSVQEKTELLPINTVVYHSGHGRGVVVAYNQRRHSQLLENLDAKKMDQLDQVQNAGINVASAMMGGLYSGDIFPYVIQFDKGYRDVYGAGELSLTAPT